uniref:Uncharacterized protein n=1 Tax=Lepeophtheirus salmonis TaxID=72036 RepID=A0A0K2V6L9_LEPSM
MLHLLGSVCWGTVLGQQLVSCPWGTCSSTIVRNDA